MTLLPLIAFAGGSILFALSRSAKGTVAVPGLLQEPADPVKRIPDPIGPRPRIEEEEARPRIEDDGPEAFSPPEVFSPPRVEDAREAPPREVHWTEKEIGFTDGYLDELVVDFVLSNLGQTTLVPEVLGMWFLIELGAFDEEEAFYAVLALADLVSLVDIPGPVDEILAAKYLYDLYKENLTPEVEDLVNTILRRPEDSPDSIERSIPVVSLLTAFRSMGKKPPKALTGDDALRAAANKEVEDKLSRAAAIYGHPVR
jgi:hypothetical protein